MRSFGSISLSFRWANNVAFVNPEGVGKSGAGSWYNSTAATILSMPVPPAAMALADHDAHFVPLQLAGRRANSLGDGSGNHRNADVSQSQDQHPPVQGSRHAGDGGTVPLHPHSHVSGPVAGSCWNLAAAGCPLAPTGD